MAEEVGMRIRNANNVLQIDGNYRNLDVVSSAIYTLNEQENNILGTFATVTIPADRTIALIGFSECPTFGVYAVRYNATTFRIYGQSTTTVRTVRVTLFSNPVQPLGGVGLLIRSKTTGEIVYNSSGKYLRVLDMITGTIAMDQVATRNYPGKNICVIQCLMPYSRTTANGGPVNQPIGLYGFWRGIVTVSGSTVSITHKGVYSAVGGAVGSSSKTMISAVYMVVDVTGYW